LLGRWGGGGEGEEVGRKRTSLEKGGESVELGVEVKSSSFRGGESLTAVPTSLGERERLRALPEVPEIESAAIEVRMELKVEVSSKSSA